jgi:excinuclease ABC subunit C
MIDYKKFPETPGVYIMKDDKNRILYIGKAVNLRRRVSSYFERSHDARISALVNKIRNIEYRLTDTALEALILESKLIKKHLPPFNIKEKDDKSFLYIEITKDEFPRVILTRGKDNFKGKRFGPFVSAKNAREALNILRRIFMWSVHDPKKNGKYTRPCFDYEIGLCPGTCVNAISKEDYKKNINNLKLFLSGKKKKIIQKLSTEMKEASKKLEFEKAEKIKRQLFALQHIEDTALISESEIENQNIKTNNDENRFYRIEGYDISNISGSSAVGSMVVFSNRINGIIKDKIVPDKKEYRKFKIKSILTPNDIGMLEEVFERRFSDDKKENKKWEYPNLIVVDGGLAQLNATRKILFKKGIKIPIIGIVKGPERKRNDIIGTLPKNIDESLIIQVRDEAHRFAISYHRKIRAKNFLS